MTFGAVNFDYLTGRFHRKVDGLVGIMNEEIINEALTHYLEYQKEAVARKKRLGLNHKPAQEKVDEIKDELNRM